MSRSPLGVVMAAAPALASTALACAALALAPLAAAGAQAVSVSAVGASTGHRLLGTLGGATVRLRIGPPASAVSGRLGFEWLTGTGHRFGVPCAGLIGPGMCPPEPIRDQARMVSWSGGVGAALLRRPRGSIDLVGELRLASLSADTRGRWSGKSLSADRFTPGADAALEAELVPRRDWPLAVQIAASVGGLLPLGGDELLDGYQPFEQGFSVTRLRLGVAWRPAGR